MGRPKKVIQETKPVSTTPQGSKVLRPMISRDNLEKLIAKDKNKKKAPNLRDLLK